MNVVLERYADRWVVSIVHPLFGEIEIDDSGNVHRIERSVDYKRIDAIIPKLCALASQLLSEQGTQQKVQLVIQHSESNVEMFRKTIEKLPVWEDLKALLDDLNESFQEAPEDRMK
jgi:hypothetical protein